MAPEIMILLFLLFNLEAGGRKLFSQHHNKFQIELTTILIVTWVCQKVVIPQACIKVCLFIYSRYSCISFLDLLIAAEIKDKQEFGKTQYLLSQTFPQSVRLYISILAN